MIRVEVIFYGAFMAPPRGEVALVFERIEGPTLDLFILAGPKWGNGGMMLGKIRFSRWWFQRFLFSPLPGEMLQFA